MSTNEIAPVYVARLNAEQLRAAYSNFDTDFQQCEVFIQDAWSGSRREGVFLGGHVQDHFFRCTSSCCTHKSETGCWEGGCIFTGAQFERHGGLGSRKKWKESIKCLEDSRPIWGHMQAKARRTCDNLTGRHVWIQWPLEDAGPTMFLGQIVDFNSLTGMSTVQYYYRYTDEQPDILCLPAEVHKLMPPDFVPSEQQTLTIEGRQASQPADSVQQHRPRRNQGNSPAYKETSDDSDDDVADDSDTSSSSDPVQPFPPSLRHTQPAAAMQRAADPPLDLHSGLGSKRPAAAGLRDVREQRRSRVFSGAVPAEAQQAQLPNSLHPIPASTGAVFAAQPTSAAADALPVGLSSAAAHSAVPAIPHAASADSGAAAANALVTAAAAAHAGKLIDAAREKVTFTQGDLATWRVAMEGVAAAGPLTDGQQQYFNEGLDAREQAYVKAQVSVPVHEEWSAYWTAALSGNALF